MVTRSADFEGLAHHFEHVALEFGKLIEEEHAIVAERNFAGSRNGAAADEAGVTDGVMRRAKRARAHEAARVFEKSGNAVDARGFDGFFERHRRQDGGNALGEHGLSGTRRTDEQNVVAAGAGNFEGALGGHLAAYVAKIGGVLAGFGKHVGSVHVHGLEGLGGIEQVDGLGERLDGEHAGTLDHGGLAGVGFGDDEVLDAAFAGGQGSRKGSPDGTDTTIEGELAEKDVGVQHLAEEGALAAQEAEGHGKVKRGAFLAYVGGGQIDRNCLKRRVIEAAIAQGGLDAFAAFADGVIGQAHYVEDACLAGSYVYLNLDEVGVNSKDGGAIRFEEHPKQTAFRRRA